MSFVSISAAVVAAAAEENPLPVPSVIFPLVAIGVFALLGIVAWSYRDVARRHANRTGTGGAPHGTGH